ncbi:unnamed protein product [Fraxinus pennsylvanica]|uniref:At2g29880-like C-terminal domain-containing protein n=1 Tax=Fraxinus pennsylvanica TaxID=56036 RepID=A0AAD1ZUK0_9LAMI|nr:unnamed protein product [Fraxinus pennsylvanica]
MTVFDESQEAYIQTQQDESTNAPSSNNYMSFPPTMETNKEFPIENNGHRKRTRTQHENSSSIDTMTRADVQEKISHGMDSITGIATDIPEMFKLLEKRERDREKKEIEHENNIWDAIKETPNLDNCTRYKAPAFIHKFRLKDAFLKMSHEEHWEWIKYNVE